MIIPRDLVDKNAKLSRVEKLGMGVRTKSILGPVWEVSRERLSLLIPLVFSTSRLDRGWGTVCREIMKSPSLAVPS